jgi:hypothetical protein
MKNNIGGTSCVVISFDTTGSMAPAIASVREKLRNLVQEMSKDIPGLKIGIIAHGDYCDGDNCMRVLDLTTDIEKIMDFISNAPATGGGDAPECYEYVLHTAKNLSWPEEGGSLIVIGDTYPHEKNPNNIDWRKEVKELKAKNINVFPLQCLYVKNNSLSNTFWEEISQIAETPLLMLQNLSEGSNAIEGVVYASAGVDAYNIYAAKSGGSSFSASMTDNNEKLKCFVDKKTFGG